jgi:CBS domain-containing protein
MADLVNPSPVVAYPDEPLRLVVYRMAETGLTRFPVVERGGHRKLVGMIALKDLLQARVRNLQEERRRERVLRTRIPFVSRPRRGTEMDSISSASRM